eukprot:4684103-Pyramimonas_sp.AAC.2
MARTAMTRRQHQVRSSDTFRCIRYGMVTVSAKLQEKGNHCSSPRVTPIGFTAKTLTGISCEESHIRTSALACVH